MNEGGRKVPAALGAVIGRCLEPDPADRYALAAELAADLQAVADDAPLCFAREPEPGRTLRRAWRNRRVLALALGVLAFAATFFAVQTAALRREARARATSTRAFARHRRASSPRPPRSLPWPFDRASAGGSHGSSLTRG